MIAGIAWADPDADAVLDHARREYQEAVTEDRTDDDGTVYRYERETTERESWSMESDTEPEWWTDGVGRDEGTESSNRDESAEVDTPRATENRPTRPSSPPAVARPEMRDFRPSPTIRRIERIDREETVPFVPVHVSLFGESWVGPVSTNFAVSPIISSVHTVNGLQAAGIIAAASDDVRGLQAAGVLNTVEGNLLGVQAAGVFNAVEGEVRGLQTAGVFNSAGDVTGGQVGLVNVADDVRGVQIGLVNVSDTMSGLPIGLINIVRDGIRNVAVWFEDTGYNYVGYQYGANIFYAIAYGGLHEDDWFENYGSLVTGLGLGMRAKLGALFVDADVSAKHVAGVEPGAWRNAMAYDESTYPAARLTAGLRLGRRLAFFAGASFDVHIPGLTERGPFHTGDMIPVQEDGFSAELYPKGFVGFSF